MKKLYLICLLAVSIVVFCSCNSGNNEDEFVRIYEEGILQIDGKDGYDTYFGDVFYQDGKFYVAYSYFNESDSVSNILCVNQDGSINSNLSVDRNQTPDCLYDGSFIYMNADNTIDFVNPEDGKISKSISYPKDRHIFRIVATDIGLVVLEESKIVLIDNEGNIKSEIEDDRWNMDYDTSNPIFKQNEDYYVSVVNEKCTYYKLDFDSSKSELYTDSGSFGGNPYHCYGEYYTDTKGEYRINFENKSMSLLVDWNQQTMKPESKMPKSNSKFIPIDDDHYAYLYPYADDSCELLLYTYNPNLEIGNKEEIVIGGYGVSENPSALWCKYLFNKSNDDYRIVLEDYCIEFGARSAEEETVQHLKLIQYFNEGNAPDIYYGGSFDYELWGKAGMVMDLSSYLNSDEKIGNCLSDSIKNIMINSDGKCYQIFTRYSLMGFVGLKNEFPNACLGWDEIDKKCSNGQKLISGIRAFDIMNGAFTYNLHKLYSDGELTSENIERILNYAYKYGTDPYDNSGITDSRQLRNGDYLLAFESITGIDSFASIYNDAGDDISFVGYPSINESIHLIKPEGVFAVSSETKNPDKCWEAIQYMFEDDVQKSIAVDWSIPANDNILREFINYSIHPELLPENEDIYRSAILCREKNSSFMPQITEKIASNYFELLDKADTLQITDWGVNNILWDETNSYYSDNKTIKDIASAIHSRLDVYISENG